MVHYCYKSNVSHYQKYLTPTIKRQPLPKIPNSNHKPTPLPCLHLFWDLGIVIRTLRLTIWHIATIQIKGIIIINLSSAWSHLHFNMECLVYKLKSHQESQVKIPKSSFIDDQHCCQSYWLISQQNEWGITGFCLQYAAYLSANTYTHKIVSHISFFTATSAGMASFEQNGFQVAWDLVAAHNISRSRDDSWCTGLRVESSGRTELLAIGSTEKTLNSMVSQQNFIRKCFIFFIQCMSVSKESVLRDVIPENVTLVCTSVRAREGVALFLQSCVRFSRHF
jgi:hypothetical protein